MSLLLCAGMEEGVIMGEGEGWQMTQVSICPAYGLTMHSAPAWDAYLFLRGNNICFKNETACQAFGLNFGLLWNISM